MAVLDVQNLSLRLPKDADRLYAIEDICFTIDRQEIVCIVGESGSGKSSLANAIMGLLEGSEVTQEFGKIYLEGENLLNLDPSAWRKIRGSKIGMIFQDPMTSLNPIMRIGKQIEEVLKIHTNLTEPERKVRVLEVMEDVKLPDVYRLANLYPHQISGGQRQRVLIAMSLCLKPVLLIADEPTSSLDVTTQKEILVLIKEIQQRHAMGVMFITHDFGVVAEIADQVIVIKQGKIVEKGTAKDVLTNPKHEYTQKLIEAVLSFQLPQPKPITVEKDILEIHNLSKAYSKWGLFQNQRIISAIENIELKIKYGETVGIVGESGSGKTTLARCIARLIESDAGEIMMGNINFAKLNQRQLRPLRNNIQIIFQDPFKSLDPRRTIGQSLTEGPINFGVSKKGALDRIERLINIVGMSPDVFNRYPHQFSGGQRQRLAIVRALAVEPTLLIGDEIVSALDVITQGQILGLLGTIQKSFNIAILFITHDLRIASHFCDRIIVMKGGHIIEEGPTKVVFTNPHHPYTKLLVSSLPGRQSLC